MLYVSAVVSLSYILPETIQEGVLIGFIMIEYKHLFTLVFMKNNNPLISKNKLLNKIIGGAEKEESEEDKDVG
jgi:hypothetical protein